MLAQLDAEIDLSVYQPNVGKSLKVFLNALKWAEWQLTDAFIAIEHATYIKNYINIIYSLTLKRYPLYYVITLYMFTYLIVAMGIIELLTPSTNALECTER